MINRAIKDTLKKLASQFPVVVVTGPRQSGKSTLVQDSFPEKKYITFDDFHYKTLAQSNPNDFLEAFPGGVIIDEAQKVPQIFDAVKLKVDQDKHSFGKYILTGSSQFKLKAETSDSLAGRAAYIRLLPFAINELLPENLLSSNPYEVIFKGLYPPLYDIENRFDSETWFENYIDTYLEKDVKGLIDVRNIQTFGKFIRICALYSGQILSMDSIAKNTGVSSPTIKTWLSILESSYIIHFIEPDLNNLGKRLIKSPKLYFTDTGLLCHLLRIKSKEDLLLSPYKGQIVETFAVSELLKQRYNVGKKPNLSYFRDLKGLEVDIIADWDKTFALEIKSSQDPAAKLSSNIRKYLRMKNDSTKGFVYSMAKDTITIDGITFLGWKDFEVLNP